ncbi:FtsX-like permease family protein [Streptomyces zagrosensis]|uniref:ABC3 transporter permease C-terminal domain-containing protein n=1 Tax=Streptomyces zagrosensis TaxID=1042984 RepID=A0A7W9QHE5_9ACTN|nr:FtsX-like permease family protein [Streptomyces zagrosensis]MBB5940221.1 hypothetical protein [Streptomyces zagrosensis]
MTPPDRKGDSPRATTAVALTGTPDATGATDTTDTAGTTSTTGAGTGTGTGTTDASGAATTTRATAATHTATTSRATTATTAPAAWARDLLFGARFAVTGGRQGWARTVLTAVGVGLGVALLLLAASVPSVLGNREERSEARKAVTVSDNMKPGPHTFLYADASTTWHDADIIGSVVRPDGPKAPAPPGVSAVPGPGEMVVSPALKDLLRQDGNKLLRERLDYRIVGTIADEGLRGPAELLYVAGSDTITDTHAERIDHYGDGIDTEPLSAVLILLIVMVCVVLLMPVAVFVGTAVRFGGEQRDRRLAALRLVGADLPMTHRIAAGEALVGALLGLAVGFGIFLVGREFVGSITVWDINVFPADIAPHPGLTALIAAAVPACAVLVTLLAMRGITIEPLGVMRHSAPKRRRLWWRIVLPALGFGLLLPLVGDVSYANDSDINTYQVASGAVLVLIGVTTLLPWLVEGFVNRFKGGPLSWQLATRRLQLSSGTAARTISGVTVAVAGAVAIQMLFAGVRDDFVQTPGHEATDPQVGVSRTVDDAEDARSMISAIRGTPGAQNAVGNIQTSVGKPGADRSRDDGATDQLVIGDCQSLRALARIDRCEEGDVFLRADRDPESFAAAGARVDLTPPGYGDGTSKEHLWTVPASARTVQDQADEPADGFSSIMATPSAVPVSTISYPWLLVRLSLDPAQPDAMEQIRNTAMRIDPTSSVMAYSDIESDDRFDDIQTGLFVGATATLLLIGVSMIVTQLEQLRDRKRLLSVLVAFGTRRSTLAYSILWQTAIPMVIGLAVSLAGGVTLGVILLKMVDRSVRDWSSMAPMVGVGAGVIALVTLVSLPPLWRMMRADGLRTE